MKCVFFFYPQIPWYQQERSLPGKSNKMQTVPVSGSCVGLGNPDILPAPLRLECLQVGRTI